MKPLLALSLAAGIGCGGRPELTVRVVAPPAGSDADPYGQIDRIEMSVVREGTSEVLSSSSFERGRDLVLRDVPHGSDLVVHLTGFVGPSEISYGRSCAFDLDEDDASITVFIARIGRWATWHASPEPARRTAASYVTPAGDGVFVGGFPGTTTVVRFEPRRDVFTVLQDSVVSRAQAALATFGDERALLIGGTTDGGDATDIAELVIPYQDAGDVIRFSDPRYRVAGVAATTLVDGAVLLSGGAAQPLPGAAFTPRRDTFVFELAGGGLELERRVTGDLAVARSGHTATRLGDEVGSGVLVVGGRGVDGLPVASAELYEPSRDAFVGASEFVAALGWPRYGHSAARLADDSVVVLGGYGADGAAVTEIEVYLPRLNRFQRAGSLPANAGMVEHSLTPLADGRLLLAGGRDRSGSPVSTTYVLRFDPIDGDVELVPTAPLHAPRAQHSAVRLCDGTVLVVGGGELASERYNPIALGRR